MTERVVFAAAILFGLLVIVAWLHAFDECSHSKCGPGLKPEMLQVNKNYWRCVCVGEPVPAGDS